jgi:large subunit ribosomal protein L13Ae
MSFKSEVVVDGKGHLLGRLASYVAKQLLQAQRVVVVRCEKLMMSGSLFRNKVRFGEFLRKRLLTNPRRGHVHYRAPSRLFWRAVRGMLPRKTARGAAALARLKVFDGMPEVYAVKKRQVVPDALKVIKLKNHRKFCVLGQLSSEVGWGKANIIEQLEQKRLARSKVWHEKRVEEAKRRKRVL